MAYKALTVEELLALMKKIQGEKTNTEFAADLGISKQYLGDICFPAASYGKDADMFDKVLAAKEERVESPSAVMDHSEEKFAKGGFFGWGWQENRILLNRA